MKQSRRLRTDSLSDARFWAMHYYSLLGTDAVDSSEVVHPFFGVSDKEVNDYFLAEFDEAGLTDPLSYLEATVTGDFNVQVEYAGEEIRYYINHSRWPKPVCLGFDGGHFALPAFRWCEVEAIGQAGTGLEGAIALLLSFPAVGIGREDDRDHIRSILVEAWKRLALTRRDRLEEMVEQIIDHRATEINWWQDSRLGWITDGRYSFRNPKTLMCEFDDERFKSVADFLEGINANR